MEMMAMIIALVALLVMILIGIHFLNGGMALLKKRQWSITRNTSPLVFEGGTSKIVGAFLVIIAVAFFICTIPVIFYLLPMIK